MLLREEVISVYKETYSVTQVLKHFNYPHGNSERRNEINTILKEEGIFEGSTGPNVLKKKQERIERTNLEKYGVINYSQTDGGKNNFHNQRERHSFCIDVDDFKVFQEQVRTQTKKNIRKIKDRPTHCEYLGVEFVDDNICNPNDYRKRSIDHRKSVYSCWLDNMSVEETCHPDNLSWVCKYVNSVKGNTDYEDFLPFIDKLKGKMV